MKALLLTLSLTASAFGGEYAVLANGFRLHADRHESDGASVRLYQKAGGGTAARGALVAGLCPGFEQEAETPQSPALPAVAAPKDPHELVEEAAKRNGLPPKFV